MTKYYIKKENKLYEKSNRYRGGPGRGYGGGGGKKKKKNTAFLFYDFLRLMIYPVIRLHNTPSPAKKIKTSVPLPKTV